MNKSFKYFTVIFINAIVLIGLSRIWVDSFALKINPNVQSTELFKIIGFSILSLIGIRFLVIFLSKRNIQSVKKKIKLSASVTFLICSFLYTDYSVKIVNNRILHNEIRGKLVKNFVTDNAWAFAHDLSNEEYKQFSELKGYHKLPCEAQNIEFNCFRPSFNGDYSFTVTFDLPLNFEIKEMNFRDGDFQRKQKVVELKDKLKVTYEESQS